MSTLLPILAITMGDPTGAGPELVVKALDLPELRSLCRPLVIGDAGVMRRAAEIVGSRAPIRSVSSPAEATFAFPGFDVLHQQTVDLSRLVYGQVDAMGGHAAYEAVIAAADLALAGQVDAIVTSALNKEALNLAGHHFAGHTELLAQRCGARSVAMMLTCGTFRVSHVSTHVSLSEAIRRVRRERIVEVARLTHEAVQRMGVPEPRLAIAGLNPHSGEGGLFGDEERREIGPAVTELVSAGIDAVGPIPPDTVFKLMRDGQYEAVVAMYHDQGHIPLKLLGFEQGVNVTLCLPIIRTSVDHGTAFAHAGKGTASPGSLIAAIRLAAQMASRE